MKRYIALVPVLLAAAIGMSQTANDTINRMVLVESTYNPIIVGAVKRNFIPEEVKPSMNKEKVMYADDKVGLTDFNREAQTAQATAVTPEKGTRGYAHLGYGNYNNLSGLAAYKVRLKGSSELALNGHIDGWNGNYKLQDNAKWHSYLYDMGLDANYGLALNQVELNVGISAAHYRYNYLAGTDAQRSNDLAAHVSAKGSAYEHYYYQVHIGYDYFDRSTHFAQATLHNEGHTHIDVSLSRDLYEWGMVSVGVNSDVLTYHGQEAYANYFTLGITPRWDYRLGDLLFVGGLNIDFVGGSDNRPTQTPLQMSPECSISYVPSRVFAAKLTLDGGRDIHTFKSLYELSPYWASKQQLAPSYTFMNAHLEANVRIIEGLHLSLGGGYKVMADALFETALDSLGTTYTGLTNHKAQVATANAGISYTHKDLVSVSAEGTYHHWMLRDCHQLLARAPQLDANIKAQVRIIPNLYAHTDVRLITFTPTEVAPRERAIIDWSLGAHYAFNKRFTFFLDGHNLLGRRHSYYAGYPAQGFNVLAGARIKF